MNIKLFVAGIPYSATTEQLEELFAQHGTVVSVAIINDRDTGRSKGFGFVEMSSEEEGQAAIAALHDFEFMGRKLVVNKARPQEERPRNNFSAPRGGGRDRRDNRGGGGRDNKRTARW